MSSKLLIAVTGITGRQGGAVARALLQDGTYDVLGVTRDPQSERAKTLADQLKIKMVKADMADEGSLRAAFQGQMLPAKSCIGHIDEFDLVNTNSTEMNPPSVKSIPFGKDSIGIPSSCQRSIMGKTLGVSSQTMTMEEVAKLFTETLGIEVRYNMVSRDEYAKLPFPGADDRANMFQFNSDYNKEFCSLRSSEDVKKYLPRGVPLRDWIMEHKEVLLQRV
ncbi:hypothetical protein GUITHDRAFT_143712 [Guillardia theta CCMP2712]|uniref:NmrA-like domain-containing protein n=1 Tax=Guillardia theta (strain CCMP2712) TaxID=905079 RepID=L1IS55_GUITC|nr:hypothetical protein GUITHDRAFT_143712 [Guillardia theta CCMP2712]EKX39101.1 hypothetical protein GUITHDRAFT_143712 [Guillardia theta CCMP2712]|eukprot:XP_005826081.1 hypothetical protein GUITHDRAFT_143712 [Guillardia theta CCMP2712]